MKTVEAVVTCPHCGAHHECASGLNHEHGVTPGHSLSICVECGQVALFDARPNGALFLRLATAAEWDAFPGEVLNLIVRTQNLMRVMHIKRWRETQ